MRHDHIFNSGIHAFGVSHPLAMLLLQMSIGVLRLCYFTCLFHFLSVTLYESFVTVRKAKQGPPQAAKEHMPRLAKTKHADFLAALLLIGLEGGEKGIQ